MDLSNILVISGKSDLSELVSQTKGGAIVKNLVNGQKFPVFKNDRISSLAEIRIFTNSIEKPLEEVFQNIFDYQKGAAIDFEFKKAEGKVLFDYFEKVLPDYDRDRVHSSDVKKVLNWYNILLAADKLSTKDEEKKEDTAAAEIVAEKKVAAPKTTAPKAQTPKATAKAKAAPKRTTTAKKAI